MDRLRVLLLTGFVFGLLPIALQSGETTKVLRKSIGAAEPFCVENLAGKMTVKPGTGSSVEAVVTVHAESEELAASVSLEQVTDKHGTPTLRVRYPLDDHGTIRYPRAGSGGTTILNLFGGSNSSIEYDGHKVKVSTESGVLLYADVDVMVPRRSVEGTFRNHVGFLTGDGLDGTLLFDTASADVTISRMQGTISVDCGSGDVKADNIGGRFSGDTGSGDITLTEFKGDEIAVDTGSGDVVVRASTAGVVEADTGSGDIHVEDADIEELEADTGSGDVELRCTGSRLRSVEADTGSGDVILRMGPNAGFDATADQGSGDIVCRYDDARPIIEDREVVGYHRGDGRIRIDVDTGSGDLVLEP